MASVNTHVSALKAEYFLSIAQKEIEKSMQKLASGKKVVDGSDDSAGLAIASRMITQIRGLDQAQRNAGDGVSFAQVADGALVEVENMLQRMRVLAVQASTGTYSTTDLSYLDLEFQALETEVGRIATSTQFNGSDIFSTGGTTAMTFHVGYTTDAEDSFSHTLSNLSFNPEGIGTTSSAATAVTTVDTYLDTIRAERADLGGTLSRLSHGISNLSNISIHTSAAKSRIIDADYAAESARLAKAQILQQASTAVLAQANASHIVVMGLLR